MKNIETDTHYSIGADEDVFDVAVSGPNGLVWRTTAFVSAKQVALKEAEKITEALTYQNKREPPFKGGCEDHDVTSLRAEVEQLKQIINEQKHYIVTMDDYQSQLSAAREALKKIADNYGGCHCDHTTNECCESPAVGEFCPHCIAEIAIAKVEGPQ